MESEAQRIPFGRSSIGGLALLPGSRARLGRPSLDSEHRAIGVAELYPTGHLNWIVAQKQRDSSIDPVFNGPAHSVDQSYLCNGVAVDPAAQTEEPWPAPTSKVGPWATRLGLAATSSAGTASRLPGPTWLLHRAKHVTPGTGLRVVEVDGQQRPVAFDPLFEEADGVRPSLVRVPASIDRGARRGPWGGVPRRLRDVTDDRSRGVFIYWIPTTWKTITSLPFWLSTWYA